MANSYKNIIIVPNVNAANGVDPYVSFRGANTAVNTEIALKVYPDSSGTLSFEGTSGQLFSITNDLTGTIFSVNDISGIPSLEIDANGIIQLAQFDGNVRIGNVSYDGSSFLSVANSANIGSLRIRNYGQVIAANGMWTGPNTGLIGPQGAQGFQGNTGAQGSQGFQGNTGSQGSQGFQGNQGFQGDTGAQGFQGFQGSTGAQGSQGFQGNQGFQGLTGPSTAINATNDTSTALLYPVMVASAGVDETPKVRTTATDFDFNAATGTLSANNYTAAISVNANTYSVKQSSPTISSNTLTLDLNSSTLFEVSLNSNITTLTINNVRNSGNSSSFVLVFVADGTARTVAWPASFRWPANTAPSLTSANTKRDVIVSFTHDGGTNWHAFVSGQNL